MGTPLVVDLDGTLINTDILHESALQLGYRNPLGLLQLPSKLKQGKASLKVFLASRTEIAVDTLPYNSGLLDWLRSEKASGRKLVLCTATNVKVGELIANHLGLFDEVIASDDIENVSGEAKARRLQERFGDKGFDYAGNSTVDLDVWKVANRGIVVNAPQHLEVKAREVCDVTLVFPPKQASYKDYVMMLRSHQWLKNTLLFTSAFASHQILNVSYLLPLVLAFLAFSLCASAVYIMNDLFDLSSDRAHPRKKRRPFASGLIPVWKGVIFAPVLLLISFILAASINAQFFYWLIAYLVLTTVYTLWLKRLALLDCLTLAILYTLRVIAGTAVVSMSISFWLIALSIFLFLSLAFVKRYAELSLLKTTGDKKISGRAYLVDDAPLIQLFGVVSSYTSVVVLVLYLDSPAVLKLYQFPEAIWGSVLAMLFWVNWVWLKAQRGEMHDDPLVFAVKDKVSLVAGLVFGVSALIAANGLT